MSQARIAVIGAGHMGGAIIGGLLAADYPAERIVATCAHPQRALALQQQFAIQAGCDNRAAAEQADIVLFCVKPGVLPQVAREVADIIIERDVLVISIAAGMMVKQLSGYLHETVPIICAMPNTPALIGWGATVLYANKQVTVEQRQEAEQIFSSVGTTLWLDQEDHLFTVAALSGSGPAYFFLLMQALEEAAMHLGLPAHIAKSLIVQTALGSAHMVDKTSLSPAELCRQVASPGGGTEQALRVLELENFRQLVVTAVKAAEQRYRKLNEEALSA